MRPRLGRDRLAGAFLVLARELLAALDVHHKTCGHVLDHLVLFPTKVAHRVATMHTRATVVRHAVLRDDDAFKVSRQGRPTPVIRPTFLRLFALVFRVGAGLFLRCFLVAFVSARRCRGYVRRRTPRTAVPALLASASRCAPRTTAAVR